MEDNDNIAPTIDRERAGAGLASIGFLSGLLLLLTNDLLWKSIFHNELTGKLSDFAGLFIFPYFWTALFPRYKKLIYPLTAVLFCLWKSPFSQPIIDSWNGLMPWQIGRVIDYSDLFALLILPVSYLYQTDPRQLPVHKFACYLLIVASLFAFTATSIRPKYWWDDVPYHFKEPRAQLVEKIKQLNIDPGYSFSSPDNINFKISSRLCQPYNDKSSEILGYISIAEDGDGSTLKVRYLRFFDDCRPGSPKKNVEFTREAQEKYQRYVFEKEFIDRLRYGRFEDQK